MRYRLEVLLAGRSADELNELHRSLNPRSDLHVRTRVLVNGHSDPLQDVYPPPDALILMASGKWRAELTALRDRPANARPPLLVVGEKDNAELVRIAMRAGARDFLSPPLDEADMDLFFSQIIRERRTESSHKVARLTAVVNAKGGAGSSVIAANLASIFNQSMGSNTLLVDMDMQFGSLPLYFNLAPRNGLVRALELVDSLDLLALEGYVLRYREGMDLLASSPEDRVTIADVPEERVDMLMKIVGEAYDDIVVDLPRWITGATAMTLEQADRIVVVMEQGVTHLRDAQQLLTVLRKDLNVDESQVFVVVNRYHRGHPVSLKDIDGALPGLRMATLPNDFKRVSQSIDVGSPLSDVAPGAAISRGMSELARQLHGADQAQVHGGKWKLLNWAR